MSTQLRRPSDDNHHAIITSLTVIIGNAQLLERKLNRGDAIPPELIIQALQSIRREGYRIGTTVRDERNAENPEESSRD